MFGKKAAYVSLKGSKTNVVGNVKEVATMMSACVMSLLMKGVKTDDIEQIILNTEMAFNLGTKKPAEVKEDETAADEA